MLERMAKHTAKEQCQVVERSLVKELERLLDVYNGIKLSGDHENSLRSQISFLLKLMDFWFSWKSGSLISDPVKIFNVSRMMLKASIEFNPLYFQTHNSLLPLGGVFSL